MGKVCPDHQLISVYFDGELPAPWKEKMESHIAGCPRCARQLQTYRLISRAADKQDAPGWESAQERVWQKLESRGGAPSSLPHRTLWRRTVAIPLPAAAAAAVLVIALTVAMAFRVGTAAGNGSQDGGILFASETEIDIPGIMPAADMESVLQYLGSRDNSEMLILHLPESRSFVNYGEPALFKAADYSRTMPGWGKP